jgi:hypothetical protein
VTGAFRRRDDERLAEKSPPFEFEFSLLVVCAPVGTHSAITALEECQIRSCRIYQSLRIQAPAKCLASRLNHSIHHPTKQAANPSATHARTLA